MQTNLVKRSKGNFLTLLELILVLAIILFLFKKVLNVYFKKPYLDKKTKQSLSGQGIDTANYKTILDSTRSKVQDINRQLMNREKEVEGIK